MNKRSFIICLTVLFLFVVTSALLAQEVLKTDQSSPEQIVKLRKFIMQALKANFGDMKAKLENNQPKAVAANGTSVAALAGALPPLYRDTHKQVYPVKGSNTYFKGAPAADIERISGQMQSAALQIMRGGQAGDKNAIGKGMGELANACSACHKAYRAKN